MYFFFSFSFLPKIMTQPLSLQNSVTNGREPINSCHDDVIKWKHFPRYWSFVRGIHRSPVNSPHKGQWRGALMFSLICFWINGWVNNREAGDLRRHRAHYGVIVMVLTCIAMVTCIVNFSCIPNVKSWSGYHWSNRGVPCGDLSEEIGPVYSGK